MSEQVWRREYSFASHWINAIPDAKGIAARQHYVDEGSKQSQDTILAVHGNPTWSFYYRSILTQFRDRCRVVAVDHVGCGLSDKPQTYHYCLSNHTNNLVHLIDELDLHNVTLVVHDWGGAIGLGAAVSRPNRIKQILVLNTGAFPPPYIPFRIQMCRWPIVGSFAVRYFNVFAVAATFMAINRLPRLSPIARSGLLAPYDSPKNRIAVARFVQDIPMSQSHPTYVVLEDLEKKLPMLADKPIHFVWGMKDWCFRPECMERLAKVWPHASRTELTDVGHYVMEEAPNEVCSELSKRIG